MREESTHGQVSHPSTGCPGLRPVCAGSLADALTPYSPLPPRRRPFLVSTAWPGRPLGLAPFRRHALLECLCEFTAGPRGPALPGGAGGLLLHPVGCLNVISRSHLLPLHSFSSAFAVACILVSICYSHIPTTSV